MANLAVMYSSSTDQWATPQDFFDELNKEFSFDLDPCADAQNHKCERYFTKEQDGLRMDWGGSRVFCNPPYGREIGLFSVSLPVLWRDQRNLPPGLKPCCISLIIISGNALLHGVMIHFADLIVLAPVNPEKI